MCYNFVTIILIYPQTEGVYMSENIEIKEIDGIDVVRFMPQGVCSKLMQFKIKNDTILEFEAVGGCSGNLGGIGHLIQGQNIHEIVKRLQRIPCGSRPTSCPDQMSIALRAYIETKQNVKVNA